MQIVRPCFFRPQTYICFNNLVSFECLSSLSRIHQLPEDQYTRETKSSNELILSFSIFLIYIYIYYIYNNCIILLLFSFQSVTKGNHTLYREYSFIYKTPRNRVSFIGMFWKCFKHIGSNGGKYNFI